MLIFGFLGCVPNLRIIEEKTESGIKLLYKPKNSSFSSNQLIIIPVNPEISLSKEISLELVKFLSEAFKNKEICIQLDTKINFVDCGENLEKITCPNCEKEIQLEYWQEIMEKAFEAGFSDLTFTINCCEAVTNLNSLIYKGNCGFSKYRITIYDPDFDKFNESKLLLDIRNICQVNFKLIFSHI